MDGNTARKCLVDALTNLRAALSGGNRASVTSAWSTFTILVDKLNRGGLEEDIVPLETWGALVTFAHDVVWIQNSPIPAHGAWLKKVDRFLEDFRGRASIDGPWSMANSPSQWARRWFQCHPDTFKKRCKDGVYRVDIISDRSYRVHVDDLPAGHPEARHKVTSE